jgi:hypothetical protein
MLGKGFVVHFQDGNEYLVAFTRPPLPQYQSHLHVASPKPALSHQNSPQVSKRQIVGRVYGIHYHCDITRSFRTGN